MLKFSICCAGVSGFFGRAISGIESIKKTGQEIMVYSDSKYIIDSVEKKWVFNWVKTGFKNKKNKDLWLRFLTVYKLHQIKFTWVKGHNGHPENERCDELAVQASQQRNLLTDIFFEKEELKLNI